MTSRRALGCLVVVAIVACSPRAHADDAAGAAGFIIYNLQFIVPNEIGVELSTRPGDAPAFRLAWTNQIPLGIFTASSGLGASERDVPLLRHRLVLGASITIGQHLLAGTDQGTPPSSTRLDGRLGYRYRWWHWHRVAPFVGLGCSLEETAAGARPSVSPEVGVHIGGSHVLSPGVQLRLQSDVFFEQAPPVRFFWSIGYSLI